METRKKSRKGLWIAIVLLAMMLIFSVAINFGVLAVSLIGGKIASSASTLDKQARMQEELVSGSGKIKALRLPIEGVIMRNAGGGGLFGAEIDMVEGLKRKIKAAEKDRSIRAIILEINSPGGAVTPTDEIYHALLDFKESGKDRKIVAFVRDMSVSGSYWLSVAGDWIIAEPTSIIGSIGVILQSYNWSDLSDKIGITDTTIKSGKNKDLLNPFQKVPPEQKDLLQAVIDSNFNYFKQVIVESRDITHEQLAPLADGRIMTAQTALENDLIDEVGYYDDAVEYTREMLGVDNMRIIRYKQRQSIFNMFATAFVKELGSLFQARSPQLISIWK